MALIFRKTKEQDVEIGMIRRALHPKDPWGGQMAFPGGTHDASDINLQKTAERETFEEIGLCLQKNGQFLGPLDQIQAHKSAKPMPLAISPFVYELDENQPQSLELQLDPEEVASFHWISVKNFFRQDYHTDYLLKRDDFQMNLPAIENHPVPIWGISYLMLKGFFDRCIELSSLEALNTYFSGDLIHSWRGYPAANQTTK